jgi:hypothetical protein
MKLLSTQLSKLKRGTRLKPMLEPQRTPARIELQKIKISNSNLIFSLDIDPVVSVDLVPITEEATDNRQVPLIQPDEDNSLYIKILRTDDIDIKKVMDGAITDLSKLDQLSAKYPQKIQQIIIPYSNDGGIISNDSLKHSYSVSFEPLSYDDRSSPKNLSLYAFFLGESLSTGKKTLLSEVYMQDIISENTVLISNNIIDLRESKFDDYLKFDIINQIKDNREAYFSDQYYSIDPHGFLKFTFFWDKIQFLRENSLFGNIIKNGSLPTIRESIISNSKISNMKIIRKRVKKNIDGFSMFNRAQQNPVVIYSSDDADGDFITAESKNRKTGQVKAKISSIAGIRNTMDYIAFSVDDYYPKKTQIGMYKYEIKVEVEDGMLNYLFESLGNLRDVNSKLLKIQNTFVPRYTVDPALSENIDNILSVLFSLRSYTREQMGTTRDEFRALSLHYEGFQKIVNFNMDLMTKIDCALSSRAITKRDSKTAMYSKNTSKLFFLEDTQEFSEIVDFSKISHIENDYFGFSGVPNIGIAKFSDVAFKNRFLTEFKKGIDQDGSYENINFADLGEKLLTSNTAQNKEEIISSNLFDLSENFFSYLAPVTVKVEEAKVKNNTSNPREYIATRDEQALKISKDLASLGVRILTPREINLNMGDHQHNTICSESILENSNLNSEKTYENDSSVEYIAPVKSYISEINKSQSLIGGIKKHYNNFNLQKSDYDLDSPLSLLAKKKNQEKHTVYLQNIKDMPNQIRLLFGSRSDIVRNNWASTENDFFSNPLSLRMMQENYSNLIKIEVLSGYEPDSSGHPNIKKPIFKKINISDLDGLKSGQSLFCRTYVVDNKSLGIGQAKISAIDSIYYNKYFIISTERGD